MVIGDSMTDKTIKYNVVVDDNGGTKKLVSSATELKGTMDGVAKSAERVAQATAKQAASTQTLAKAKAASMPTNERAEYDIARSGVGTGAAARDFANQAQGLGGLVRLYAVYAANLFAVSTAFNALKNAADTTNLVRGLDTLGAASGRNLGELSKRLVATADGAISLREAMTATAQASAAGLSGKLIERLGSVAKNASFALGVSMPDALNRLSRGVTKLEPELLDELGIFTKIEPAVQKYALSVGKSVAQLTDFERRQAFANAVAEEGEKKFGQLGETSANAYDKLLATLKNTTFKGLELINLVLLPIVKLLSESPGALAAGLALIGTVLLKQAIPAIGQFREGLRSAAADAVETAKGKAGDALAARKQLNKLIENEVEKRADKELEIFERAEKQLQERVSRGDISKRSLVYKLLVGADGDVKDISDITDKQIEQTQKALNERAAKVKDPAAKEKLRVEQEALDALKSTIKAEEDLVAVKVANRKQVELALEANGQLGRVQKAAADAQIKASKDAIVSNAAYNASLLGVTNSFTLMKAEIATSNLQMGLFGKSILFARAGVASLTAYVATFGAAINKALIVVTTLITIAQLLDSITTKAGKEVQKFQTSIDTANSSIENADRTLAAIEKRQILGQTTIQDLEALSNALQEISSSAEDAVTNSIKALDAVSKGSWLDKLKEGIKDFAGFGIGDKLAETLSEQLDKSVKLFSKAGLGDKASSQFKSALGLDEKDELSVANIEKAIEKLDSAAKKELIAKLKSLGIELGNLASSASKFKSVSETAFTKYQEFIRSNLSNDPLFGLAEAFRELGFELAELASSNNVESLSSKIDDLLKNPQRFVLYSDTAKKSLVSLSNDFQILNKDVENNKTKLEEATAAYEKAIKAQKGLSGAKASPGFATGDSAALVKQVKNTDRAVVESLDLIDKLKANELELLKRREEITIKSQKIADEESEAAQKRSAEYTASALGNAAEKAAATIARARLGGLSGENLAREQLRINLQELAAEQKNLDITKTLIFSQDNLTGTLEVTNALLARQYAKTDEERNAAEAFLRAGQAFSKLSLSNQFDEGAVARAKEGLVKTLGNELGAAAVVQLDKLLRVGRSRADQLEAKQKELTSRVTAAQITGGRDISAGQVQDLKETLSLISNINAVELTRSGIISNIAGVVSQEAVDRENTLQSAALSIKQAQELLDIDLKIANANKDSERDKLNGYRTQILTRQEIEKQNQLAQEEQKRLQIKLNTLQQEFNLQKQISDESFAKLQASLEIDQARLTSAAELYGYSQDYVIAQQNAIDLAKLELDASKQKASIEDELALKRLQNTARLEALNRVGASTEEFNAAVAQFDLEEKIANSRIRAADTEAEARRKILEINKQNAEQQAKYNELLASSANLADALKGVFGEVGEAVGGLVTSFTQFGIQTDKNARALDAINKKINEQQEYVDPADIKEKAKLEKKARDDELKGYAQMAGAAKKMFNEKTAAAKGFAIIEKALHLFRMASMVQEVGATLANTATKIAAHLGESAVLGTKSILNALSYFPPPLNFAAAAATAAVVGKLLGNTISVDPGSKIGAEQQQKVQGTAMGYNSQGELVQVREGVFGDTEAKSESIANSLEILRDNSIKGLSLNNKMLKALEKINEGIQTAAKNIYTVGGVRTGLLPGIEEGTTRSTGLLGSSTIGAGLGAAGGAALGAKIGTIFGLPGAIVGGLLGGLVGSLGLYSKKVTKEVVDSGIQLKGSFLDLARGADGTAQIFAKVNTTTTRRRLFKKSTSTTTEDILQNFDITDPNQQQALEGITQVFQGGLDLLLDIGSKAGKSGTDILSTLGGLQINERVSLRGLKGEDLEKELQAVFSSILDQATSSIFSTFKKYAEFGEGLLETVVRVVDTNTKIDQLLKNIGLGGNLAQQFDITEVLAKNAGGLSQFVDQVEFFSENFLTEAERVGISAKAVNDEMFDLAATTSGLTEKQIFELAQGTKLSSERFKELVQGLDVTTDAGQALLEALLRLAPAFKESVEKRETERNKLLGEYNDLVLSNTQKLEAQRDALDASNRALFDQVQALKAAQDDATKARTVLTNAYNREKNALESLKGKFTSAFDSIKKAIEDITGGPSALLSPMEQYQQDKGNFERILQLSRFGTGEEQAKALSELPGAANKLLESSRTFNASSEAYFTDFNMVTSALQSASSVAEEQVSETQRLIDKLDTQYNAVTGNTSELSNNTNALISFTQALTNYTTALEKLDALKQAPAINAQVTVNIPPLNVNIYQPSNGDSNNPGGATMQAGGSGDLQTSPTARTLTITATTQGVVAVVANASLSPLQQISTAATGGYVNGLTLVGEEGPELVDFTGRPGQVYNANQTRDMFMPQANMSRLINGLTDEVQRLRSELRELRQDQQRQTGDIIMSNYDANNRAAEEIGSSVENAVSTKDWQQRTAVTIK